MHSQDAIHVLCRTHNQIATIACGGSSAASLAPGNVRRVAEKAGCTVKVEEIGDEFKLTIIK
jgi:hypothetical protein